MDSDHTDKQLAVTGKRPRQEELSLVTLPDNSALKGMEIELNNFFEGRFSAASDECAKMVMLCAHASADYTDRCVASIHQTINNNDVKLLTEVESRIEKRFASHQTTMITLNMPIITVNLLALIGGYAPYIARVFKPYEGVVPVVTRGRKKQAPLASRRTMVDVDMSTFFASLISLSEKELKEEYSGYECLVCTNALVTLADLFPFKTNMTDANVLLGQVQFNRITPREVNDNYAELRSQMFLRKNMRLRAEDRYECTAPHSTSHESLVFHMINLLLLIRLLREAGNHPTANTTVVLPGELMGLKSAQFEGFQRLINDVKASQKKAAVTKLKSVKCPKTTQAVSAAMAAKAPAKPTRVKKTDDEEENVQPTKRTKPVPKNAKKAPKPDPKKTLARKYIDDEAKGEEEEEEDDEDDEEEEEEDSEEGEEEEGSEEDDEENEEQDSKFIVFCIFRRFMRYIACFMVKDGVIIPRAELDKITTPAEQKKVFMYLDLESVVRLMYYLFQGDDEDMTYMTDVTGRCPVFKEIRKAALPSVLNGKTYHRLALGKNDDPNGTWESITFSDDNNSSTYVIGNMIQYTEWVKEMANVFTDDYKHPRVKLVKDYLSRSKSMKDGYKAISK